MAKVNIKNKHTVIVLAYRIKDRIEYINFVNKIH